MPSRSSGHFSLCLLMNSCRGVIGMTDSEPASVNQRVCSCTSSGSLWWGYFLFFLSIDGPFFAFTSSLKSMPSSLPGGLRCHWMWDAEKPGLTWSWVSEELRRGSFPPVWLRCIIFQLHCFVKPILLNTLHCVGQFSGVHHRSRPYRKVQPQSSISLQTTSHTGKQVLHPCLILCVSSHIPNARVAILKTNAGFEAHFHFFCHYASSETKEYYGSRSHPWN